MLTTSEAAEILGVTPRRVVALVESGALIAERFGRQWMIDERSVRDRVTAPKLSGRPKLGQKDLLALSTHTLMNRDHPVLDFTYDRKQKRARIERVHEEGLWGPLGIGRRSRKPREGWRPPVPNEVDLALWLEHRYMPPLRPEAARILRETGEPSTDMLMFSSLGLNLSDQYWFKPVGASLAWRDVNFFDNDYMATRPHRSPDSSTPGALEKWWEKRGGQNWLLKASSTAEEREPYNELLATLLCGRLLDVGEFVPYELEEHDGRACSACPTLATPETEFVSANDAITYFGITEGHDLYRGYVRACDELGIRGARTALAKMIVCDHIMANFDRHRANFGLIRNADTLDGWRIAPLFDNGAAFFSRATIAELRLERYTWTSNPFEEYPLAQLARVEDMSWYDPDMLVGFAEEVQQVLGSNPHLSDEVVSRMAYHVQHNIDTVNDLYVERVR
ncbi:MAG: DNA-binding protein [Eggerthellaceae bacterium]|nr:DNA-binding protein [Eggerthellaceae bacterium]